MKKISAIALILIILTSLASCTSDNPNKGFDPDAKIINYKELPNYGYIDLFDAVDPDYEHYDISLNASTEIIDYEEEYDEYAYLYDEDDEEEEFDEEEYERDLERKKLAQEYFYNDFKNKQTQIDDFIVTEFKDGWCINQYIFDKKKFKSKKNDIPNITIAIPRELAGRKVLKLGCYIDKTEYKNDLNYFDEDNGTDCYIQKGFLCTVPMKYNITLKIPDTVTDISCGALDEYREYIYDYEYDEGYDKVTGYITEIEVDVNNPYYKSDDGVMLSKDGRWLLFLRSRYCDYEYCWKYTVPDSVKYIADTNLCHYDSIYELTIGPNVEKIYSTIWFGDCGTTNCIFNVEKNSYAEKWLKAQGYSR